jgi:hypothetical protein
MLGQQVIAEQINTGLQHEVTLNEEGIYIVTYYSLKEQKQYRQKVQVR